MKISQTVGGILKQHVTLEVECIDRMYLNLYVPTLQHVNGAVGFFRNHRQQPIASSALMAPISKKFVEAIERFAADGKVPVVEFRKGRRKDDVADVAKERLAQFDREEGVVKEGRALRAETTINDARDFGIGKRIHNLPALRQAGFQANRRLLQTERISFDCILAEETYQLRRLRLHGLIQRIPQSHRYDVTDTGFRAALFYSKVYSRILRPGVAVTRPEGASSDSKLRRTFDAVNSAVNSWIENAKLSAA